MALLFMDGFDAGDVPQKWPVYRGGASDPATRFSAGRSWKISDVNHWLKRPVTPSASIYVGFAMYINGANSGTGIITFLGDSGATSHLNLRLIAQNQIGLYTGNTQLATYMHSSSLQDQWCYYELGGTIADTGGTAIVRLNGVVVINFTGDTRNGGTSTNIDMVSFLGIGSFGSPVYYLDDFYICDDTGPAPYNTFLGDVRVATMTPNGAGSSTGFTSSSGANYTAVDELPYSASDFVSATTSGTRDTYAMSDLTGNYNVLAVQNNVIAKKTDAGGTALKPAIVAGGTVYYGPSTVLTPSDVTISDMRTTNPATSAAWTMTDVNALEAGMEIA